MKMVSKLIFVATLTFPVHSAESERKEIVPEGISLQIGADCGKDRDYLDYIVQIKNNGEHEIFLSDSFLGLTEEMSDAFALVDESSGKNVPYLGIIRENNQDFHFPYRLGKGQDVKIRYPISRFYKISLRKNYKIYFNVEFLSEPKKKIFVGYAITTLGASDCEKEMGYAIKYRKLTPTGFFMDAVDLGGKLM